jgi:hypothetical protein
MTLTYITKQDTYYYFYFALRSSFTTSFSSSQSLLIAINYFETSVPMFSPLATFSKLPT